MIIGQRRIQKLPTPPAGLIAYWQCGEDSGLNPINEPISGYDAARLAANQGSGYLSLTANHKGEANKAAYSSTTTKEEGYFFQNTTIPASVWRQSWTVTFHMKATNASYPEWVIFNPGSYFYYRGSDRSLIVHTTSTKMITTYNNGGYVFIDHTYNFSDWFFCAIRYNGSSQVLFTKNAVTKTGTGLNESLQGSGICFGGGRELSYSGYRYYSKEKMAYCDFRLFNRALSDDEVQTVRFL